MFKTKPHPQRILLASLVAAALASLYSPGAKAQEFTCNTTIYFCGGQAGLNAAMATGKVTINTNVSGGTAPLQGYGIYLQSSGWNGPKFNDLEINTTGSSAAAIKSTSQSVFFKANNLTIRTSGSNSDGINMGSDSKANYDALGYVTGFADISISRGIAVRTNNFQDAGANSVIILAGGARIAVTGGGTAQNQTEATGYAVYAGNRDRNLNGLGTTQQILGPWPDTPGNSYVFVAGRDLDRNPSDISTTATNGHAVYANKGGLIQLGDGARVHTSGTNAYALYASAERQQLTSSTWSEYRPGYIYLEGGLTLYAEKSAIVMRANGAGSIIANKAMDIPVIPDDFKNTSRIQGLNADKSLIPTRTTSGVFDIVGNLDAINGGEISLNMADGSFLLGTTDRHATAGVESFINLNMDGASSQWQINGNSTLTHLGLGNGASLQYQSSGINLSTRDGIALGNGGGVIDTNGFNQQLNDPLHGEGSLTKAGEGTLTLSGNNTYAGGTHIEAGTLAVSSDNALGNSNGGISFDGGTLQLDSSLDLSANRTIALESRGGTINTQSFNSTLPQGITGTGHLTKQGSGTLTLAGNSTYSGGTTIEAGTLQLGTGGNSGMIQGDVLNQGTLAFNRASAATFSGAISGAGEVNHLGTGKTTFTGINTYSGATLITAGVLAAGTTNSFSPNSAFTLQANGALDLQGFSQTLASLNNGGVVRLGGTPGTLLNISGDYTGQNGLMIFNGQLAGDASPIDQMVVQGNTSGDTRVQVHNVGGNGEKTLNGIKLITVQGQSSGEFSQEGRIVAGAYDYTLARGVGTNQNNWYLTNQFPGPKPKPEPKPGPKPTPKPEKVRRPEGGSYAANVAASGSLFALRWDDHSQQRLYNSPDSDTPKLTSVWLRSEEGHTRNGDDSDQLRTRSNRTLIQLGGDIAQWDVDQSSTALGVMAGYGNHRSTTRSRLSGYKSTGRVEGYSLGLYGTWQQQAQEKTGWYVDGWIYYSWLDNTVSGHGLPTEDYDTKGLTASVETGYTLKLGENDINNTSYYLQPQAQIIWMGTKAGQHREKNRTLVRMEGEENLQARLGMKTFIKTEQGAQPFAEANWIHNSKRAGANMDGETVYQEGGKNIGELRLGVEGQTSKQTYVSGKIGHQVGQHDYRDTNLMLEIKAAF